MKAFAKFTAYIFILLGFCGCNPDVFIDDFQPSVSELTLDGNGDEAAIHFSGSGWRSLDIPVFEQNNIKVYDAAGNLIVGQMYLDVLGKIVYHEEMLSFTIEGTSPEEVKITVDENMRSSSFQFLLVASNEYESKEIHVTVSPSDRYELEHITYSLSAYSYDGQRIEEKNSVMIENHIGSATTYHLFPYKNEFRRIMFSSDNPEAFRLLAEYNQSVEIPSLVDGYLVMNGEQAKYTSKQQNLPLPFPDTEQKDIIVQPYTTSHITLWLEYEWFETPYTLYAIHPKTGKQRIISGTVQSMMPKNYFITRKNIND